MTEIELTQLMGPAPNINMEVMHDQNNKLGIEFFLIATLVIGVVIIYHSTKSNEVAKSRRDQGVK